MYALPQLKEISFAVNTHGCDKDWDFKKLSGRFQDKIGTIHDVMHHVKAGHAICAGLLNNKWRCKSNVTGSQWVLLDIDNSGKDDGGEKCYRHQMTIDEALANEFVRSHCSLIYTTSSHTPEWHKFRLIFLLPDYVGSAETVEVVTRYLMKLLPHDPACKDASRVFYGSTEAQFPLVQPNATLPQQWINEAIAIARQEKAEYERRILEIARRRQQFEDKAKGEGWDLDHLVKQALNCIPSRSMGSGNYNECRQVLMALVAHYGAAEAEMIAEAWSPSIKGTTWNIRAKIRSFRRNGIGIGTLFHIAKQYGFKFPESSLPDRDKVITRSEWVIKQHNLKNGEQQARAFLGRIYAGVPSYRDWIKFEVDKRSLSISLSEEAEPLTEADKRQFPRLPQAIESALTTLCRSANHGKSKLLWQQLKQLPIDSEEYKQTFQELQGLK